MQYQQHQIFEEVIVIIKLILYFIGNDGFNFI